MLRQASHTFSFPVFQILALCAHSIDTKAPGIMSKSFRVLRINFYGLMA